MSRSQYDITMVEKECGAEFAEHVRRADAASARRRSGSRRISDSAGSIRRCCYSAASTLFFAFPSRRDSTGFKNAPV